MFKRSKNTARTPNSSHNQDKQLDLIIKIMQELATDTPKLSVEVKDKIQGRADRIEKEKLRNLNKK